jgi:CcmD family protein
MLKRLALALVLAASAAASTPAIAAQPRPAQEEFVPVTDADIEQIPAAPFVLSAYAAAWVIVFLYIWSIWRRLNRVERELADLGQRGGPKGR